VLDGLFTI
jgi:exosortase H (IPTLxxWG-CTERM-specific)